MSAKLTCSCGHCPKCHHRSYMQARRAQERDGKAPEHHSYNTVRDERVDDLTHYARYFAADSKLDAHSDRSRAAMTIIRQLNNGEGQI